MSFSFGKKSRAELDTCDPRLQDIAEEAIKIMNFSVLQGHRSEEEQKALYNQGKTKLLPPKSKHNSYPSKAFDIVPYPVDWSDKKRFTLLAGIIIAIGAKHGVKIRWGGAWDMNYDKIIDDQSFDDLPHFEIMED